jgi:phage antirepressor YoqD-like protein
MSSFTLVQINGELRIHDLEIGRRLGFADPLMIRKLIKSNAEKLNKISVLYAAEKTPSEHGGRPATEYYLDRKQSIFICMKSETDNAFEVQADIVRVYDAHLGGTPTAPALNPANLSRLQLIEMAMQAEQERLALEQHVAVIQPKAQALDLIATSSHGSLNITEAAKTLQVQPKKLFQWMHGHEWIYRRPGGSGWVAYQNRLQQGLLEHKVTTTHREDGSEKIVEQVRVTGKGLTKLAKIFRHVSQESAA